MATGYPLSNGYSLFNGYSLSSGYSLCNRHSLFIGFITVNQAILPSVIIYCMPDNLSINGLKLGTESYLYIDYGCLNQLIYYLSVYKALARTLIDE